MGKKGFLRAALFMALFTALAVGVSAQVTISGGFALSSMEVEGVPGLDSEIGFGGNIYADYLLPISIPLSLGFEVGFDTASVSGGFVQVTGNVIPLLARVAYHFDLMTNLDLYLVGKIGYVVGWAEEEITGYGSETYDGFGGVGFGIDVGAAYYFTPRFGVFGEAGFDRYNLKQKFDENGYSYTVKVPFSRFFTVGVSTKF
jgi:hypothetical protein